MSGVTITFKLYVVWPDSGTRHERQRQRRSFDIIGILGRKVQSSAHRARTVIQAYLDKSDPIVRFTSSRKNCRNGYILEVLHTLPPFLVSRHFASGIRIGTDM